MGRKKKKKTVMEMQNGKIAILSSEFYFLIFFVIDKMKVKNGQGGCG